MKKLTLFLLLLFTASALSAQSDKPRDWKQLISLLNQAENVQYCYNSLDVGRLSEILKDSKKVRVVSLKTLKPEQLNDIERNLLLKYSDVAVKRNVAYQAYFTIDEENRIGVVSLTGEELYPPIEGAVRSTHHPDIALMGVPIFYQISEQRRENIRNNMQYNVAFPIFKCSGAIKFSSKGAKAVIPYGEYDYCYMTSNRSGSYFYVCRNEGDKELWGVYDKSGKQLVECNYKSVEFRKGKFIGHNDMTMDDVMESYLVQIEKKEHQAQIRAMIANIMQPVGVGLVNIGSAMQQSQSGSSSAGISTGGSSSKASAGGGKHPGMSRSELQQRYNAEIQTIRRLRDSWSMHVGTSTEVSNQNTLRACKANIQSIKSSAAQHGITLQTDPLENWTPSK